MEKSAKEKIQAPNPEVRCQMEDYKSPRNQNVYKDPNPNLERRKRSL